MHKHCTKRIAAGLLTAAMLVPMTVSYAPPLRVSAGEILGESTFSHKMLPWHTVEASPARQNFDITEGAVHITILHAWGAERAQWDLQFRHRGLDFKANHEYKVSFKVKAKREGMELCGHISNLRGDKRYFELDGRSNDMHMGPDMDGQWGNLVKLTTEYQEFSGIFTPTEDIYDAEWVFCYANDSNGYGGNAEDGDEIWFDDMSVFDLTASDCTQEPSYGYTARGYSGQANNFISVNQLGYYPSLVKHATLSDNGGDLTYGAETISLSGSYDYEIVSVKNDSVVYTGKTGEAVRDNDSKDTICKIDFTEFNTPGKYYIRIKDQEWRSLPFGIGNDIYQEKGHDLLTNALNYFYQNRSGSDITAKYITSGEKNYLAHPYNRDEAIGLVQTKWLRPYPENVSVAEEYGTTKIDVSGGWFTGSDYDKYMTEGGITVWTLQNMYERAAQSEAGRAKFADGSGTVVNPESDNQIPDILDECRYELDFMAKMKVQSDEPTWGEYAGLYYHKLHGIGFSVYSADYEHDYHAVYMVEPPTFAATLNYAACAAQGARLWAPYDPEYAAGLLKSAKEAYQAYKKFWYEADGWKEEQNSLSQYAPVYYWDQGDMDVSDDDYWAACELYITAKAMNDADSDTYLKELSRYQKAFQVSERISGGENDSSLTLFNWGNTGAAGSMSLLLHQELLSDQQEEKLRESFIKTADAYLEIANGQGYGVPYQYDPGYYDPFGMEYERICGYEYGSNERVLNNMFAMAYTYDLTGDIKYLNGVAGGMDYLLGNNPMAYSFITGYGDYHVKNPVHWYWKSEIDHDLPKAPDGVIASGPNAGLNDNYVQALGFVRGNQTNPSQRCYADSVESWSTNSAALSSNASLAWIVSFMQDEMPDETAESDVPGDANGDGKTGIADAVLLSKYLLGSGRIKSPKAADLNKDGMLTAADLTLLKRELLK